MSKNAETVIRNIVYILILELVLLPIGIWIYLQRMTWHLYHISLIFAYLYGIVLIMETANILIKYMRFGEINEIKDKKD